MKFGQVIDIIWAPHFKMGSVEYKLTACPEGMYKIRVQHSAQDPAQGTFLGSTQGTAGNREAAPARPFLRCW